MNVQVNPFSFFQPHSSQNFKDEEYKFSCDCLATSSGRQRTCTISHRELLACLSGRRQSALGTAWPPGAICKLWFHWWKLFSEILCFSWESFPAFVMVHRSDKDHHQSLWGCHVKENTVIDSGNPEGIGSVQKSWFQLFAGTRPALGARQRIKILPSCCFGFRLDVEPRCLNVNPLRLQPARRSSARRSMKLCADCRVWLKNPVWNPQLPPDDQRQNRRYFPEKFTSHQTVKAKSPFLFLSFLS